MKRFVSIGECMIEMSGGAGGDYHLGFAGDTLNTAYYARVALGPDWSVDYVTALGDDLYSTQMLEFFERHQIGTSHIRRIEGKRPGLYLIHQAAGDRHFTYWRDNAAARQLADDPRALAEAIKGADLVYFSGITLAILLPDARARLFSAIESARGEGSKIAFDPNIRPVLWPDKQVMKSAFASAAALADFALPTHGDDQPFFADKSPLMTAKRYLDWGATEVIVKNGAEDAIILTKSEEQTIPAHKSVQMVDATGAGDSFNGTYLSKRLNGAPITEAAIAAHRTASIVVGQRGALAERSLVT